MRQIGWSSAFALVLAISLTCCTKEPENLKEIARQQAGDQVIVLLNEMGKLRPGKNTYFLEVRNASTNQLVDSGNIRINAMMAMTGMAPMTAETEVNPTRTPGRYKITSNFSMAGSWQIFVVLPDGRQIQFNLFA